MYNSGRSGLLRRLSKHLELIIWDQKSPGPYVFQTLNFLGFAFNNKNESEAYIIEPSMNSFLNIVVRRPPRSACYEYERSPMNCFWKISLNLQDGNKGWFPNPKSQCPSNFPWILSWCLLHNFELNCIMLIQLILLAFIFGIWNVICTMSMYFFFLKPPC